VQREFGEVAVPVVSGRRPSIRAIDPDTQEEAVSKAKRLLEQFRKSCRQKQKNAQKKLRRTLAGRRTKPGIIFIDTTNRQ
jgi:hypothetical protein